MIDRGSLQSASAFVLSDSRMNPPGLPVSRTLRAQLRTALEQRPAENSSPGWDEVETASKTCTSGRVGAPVLLVLNGSGRFRVPANVRGNTGRRQSGHRLCGVSMAGRQTPGNHGGFQQLSVAEKGGGAGLCRDETSSNSRELDLCGA